MEINLKVRPIYVQQKLTTQDARYKPLSLWHQMSIIFEYYTSKHPFSPAHEKIYLSVW